MVLCNIFTILVDFILYELIHSGDSRTKLCRYVINKPENNNSPTGKFSNYPLYHFIHLFFRKMLVIGTSRKRMPFSTVGGIFIIFIIIDYCESRRYSTQIQYSKCVTLKISLNY